MLASLGLVVIALWAADAGTNALPPRLILDSGTCPEPEDGPYSPQDVVVPHRLAGEILLPHEGETTILQILVIPPFEFPHALRIEVPKGSPGNPARPRLRVAQTKIRFWQSATRVALDDESGLARVRKKVVMTRLQPVDDELVALLEDVWGAALARTQYVPEILAARGPTGGAIKVLRADGTYNHLWHNKLSGSVTRAPKGSALGDLLAVKDLLIQYVEAASDQQPALLSRIKGDLVRLRTRFATNESCVTVRAAGALPME